MKDLLSILIILILSVFMFEISVRAESEVLKLETLLDHALNESLEIKRDKANYYSRVESLSQARAGYRPSVSLEADATHSESESKGNTFFTQEGSNFSKTVGGGISQPLFRGGSTRAKIKESKSLISVEYWQLSKKYQDVLFETLSSYWDVYLQQFVVGLNESNHTLLTQRLKETQAQFKVGVLTRTDVSQAQARLAAADADLAQARGALEKAKATLERLTHLSIETLEKPIIPPDIPESLDIALSEAMSYNPDIQSTQFIKEASQNAVRSIQGEFLPQVNLDLSKSRSYDPAPGFLEEQDSESIQVKASIPLYTGGATRSRLRQALYMDMANKYDREDIKERIKENIIILWHSYKASEYSVEARQKQVESTKIAADGTKKEHEYGVRTVIDLLDSDQEYLDAQVELIRAQRDMMIAGFDLSRQIGVLSPDFFHLKNTLPNNQEIMDTIGGNWHGFHVDYPD